MSRDPIAYTYEADTHCPECAEERFGRSEDGFIAEDCEDREGNSVGIIAPWDEWRNSTDDCDALSCGTCLGEIDIVHVDGHGRECPEGEAGGYFDRFDLCEAYSLLAHDYGLYVINTRLGRIGFRPSPDPSCVPGGMSSR